MLFKKILTEEKCAFDIVRFSDFKSSFQGSSLRSSAYEKYLVLCHGQSKYHAGWMVCPYVRNSICPVSKGLLQVKTKLGGTNKFLRHMKTCVESRPARSEQHATLSLPCRNDIAKNAMLAVVLDLRLLSFTENQDDMACYFVRCSKLAEVCHLFFFCL